MPIPPLGVLTPAQQQLAGFEGIVIGLIVTAIVLVLVCLFLLLKQSAELQTVRRALGIESVRDRARRRVAIVKQRHEDDAQDESAAGWGTHL